jgi:signal transduction histidine kinase/PAS domain-containing protein
MAPVAQGLVPILVGYVLAALATLSLALYTVRKQDTAPALRWFSVLLLATFLWAAAYAARVVANTLQTKLLLQYVAYLGIVTVPVAWVTFAFCYTGRDHYLSRRRLLALSAVPAGTLVLVVTNARNLFYRSVGLLQFDGTPLVGLEAGPAFYLWAVYAYLLLGAGFVLLVRFAANSDSLYQLQAAALAAAAGVPLGLNALFLIGFTPIANVDVTPITFALSGLLIAIAVFYGQFVQLMPVAREALIEALDDGILVADDAGTVVYANPVGRSLLACETDDQVVGADVEALLPADGDRATDGGSVISVDADGSREWYMFRQIDLDDRPSVSGEVYNFVDISERRELERQLRGLQQTHQQLMTADSLPELGETVVTAARDILDLPITALWQYDEADNLLRPVGITPEGADLIGGAPVFEPGNSLAWETFQRGTIQVFEDLSEHTDAYNQDGPITSEIQVPVGDAGLIVTGSSEQREFEDVDLDLLRILASATESAFAQLGREQELREREQNLDLMRQVFSRVLRHNIRNELQFVQATNERLASDLDGEHGEMAARTVSVIDDVIALSEKARDIERLVEQDQTPRSLALRDILRRILRTVSAEFPAVSFRLDAPPECVVEAPPAIGLVFENLVENAAEHNTAPEPTVEVVVSQDEDVVEVSVRDNGPGIPENELSVRNRGEETALEHGTGLGLWVVDWVITNSAASIEFDTTTGGEGGTEVTVRLPR